MTTSATITTASNVMGAKERRMIKRAMDSPESCVLVIDYRDRSETRTRRVVSPIRFTGNDSFLGLCLCREEPRRFDLDRCSNVRLAPAHEYSMPVPIETP